MIDILEIMPYQLFLEYPVEAGLEKPDEKTIFFQEITCLKQKFNEECDKVMQKYVPVKLV